MEYLMAFVVLMLILVIMFVYQNAETERRNNFENDNKNEVNDAKTNYLMKIKYDYSNSQPYYQSAHYEIYVTRNHYYDTKLQRFYSHEKGLGFDQRVLRSEKVYGNPAEFTYTNTSRKSVVGSAVVGGIIGGEAGAVVGALSAVDKNNNSGKEITKTYFSVVGYKIRMENSISHRHERETIEEVYISPEGLNRKPLPTALKSVAEEVGKDTCIKSTGGRYLTEGECDILIDYIKKM